MSEYSYPQAMFLRQEQVQFLKQLSDEDFWNYAVACAHMSPYDHEPSDTYLVCDLGAFGCVLPLADLRAVVPSPARFSYLPDTPVWMLGLAAWSNTILAVVDLRAYLLQNVPAPTRSPGMLLVAQHEDLVFGLLAPVVGTMASLDLAHLQSPEHVEVTYHPPCAGAIKGISMETKEVMGMEEMDMAFLLDISVILTDIAKNIQMTAAYG